MNEFLAVDSRLPELKALYLSCFEEDKRAADIIFQNILSSSYSYCARVDGELAAALYLLPCSLSDGGKNLKAHYLMGASTLQRFRGRGLMSGLIKYALEDAKSRGDLYSVLEPANPSLYDFYSRLGYRRAYQSSVFDFYSDNNINLNSNFQLLTKNSFDTWAELRFNICMNIRGSVQWTAPHLLYSSEVCAAYGGGALGCDFGYAVFIKDEQGVRVGELMCAPERLKELLTALAQTLGVDKLRVRCPVALAERAGIKNAEKIDMGMLLPLFGEELTAESAYLGLSLD